MKGGNIKVCNTEHPLKKKKTLKQPRKKCERFK